MSQLRRSRLYTKVHRAGFCLVCDQPITNKRRSTFCSKPCSDQHYIRTRPDFARFKVFERDQGVCAACGMDTMADRIGPKRSRGTGHLWQADHIVPVIEGGGECTLDNLRTLCTACHKAETAALARRRSKSKPLENVAIPIPQSVFEFAVS